MRAGRALVMSFLYRTVMMNEAGAIRKTRGRPRSRGLDDTILEAAFAELGRVGYRGMTVEGVASVAGTTKPTVYLRFRTKAELAARAVEHARERTGARPSLTGDLRRDLVDELERFRSGLLRPHGLTLVGTVLAEQDETPELIARLREHVVAPRRARFRAVLSAAQVRGELAPGADVASAIRALVGAVYAQALDGEPFPGGWSERIVDLVLGGLRPR
jgi:AcrR family transcriptional regulator